MSQETNASNRFFWVISAIADSEFVIKWSTDSNKNQKYDFSVSFKPTKV